MSLPGVLRFLQTVWFTMLASIVLLAAVPEIAPAHPHRIDERFFLAIVVLTIWVIVICFAFRRRLIVRAAQRLAQGATDSQTLRRWQTGHILHVALSESVTLYGIVLRYQGLALSQVAPFYVGGFVLMLFGAPRDPGRS